MKIWIDANISHKLAPWINEHFPAIEAVSLLRLGLREETDSEIFFKAKEEDVVIFTKDEDFVELVKFYGHPPQVVWLTCGNTSQKALCEILVVHFAEVIELLNNGKDIVELSGARV